MTARVFEPNVPVEITGAQSLTVALSIAGAVILLWIVATIAKRRKP